MWYLLLSTVNRVFICILLLIHGHEWGTHEMAPCNMPRWNIDVSNRMRTNEKVFINSYVWPQQSCWALWFSFSFLSSPKKGYPFVIIFHWMCGSSMFIREMSFNLYIFDIKHVLLHELFYIGKRTILFEKKSSSCNYVRKSLDVTDFVF